MIGFANRDADIVRAVLQGRRERFEVLVLRYLKDLHAVAFAYSRNHQDAEEIAQEAFLRAYQSLGQLREPRQFRHWLLTITRNVAHEQFRKHQRSREAGETAGAVPSPAQALEREEQRAILRQHLDQLDERHREVLYLHYFAGRSTREIAALLELSRENVKKRLERARAALGASMLASLEADAPRDMRKAAGAIMAAVIASAITPAGATGSAIAGGGSALAMKAASVLLASLLGVGILLMFSRDAGEAKEEPPRAASATPLGIVAAATAEKAHEEQPHNPSSPPPQNSTETAREDVSSSRRELPPNPDSPTEGEAVRLTIFHEDTLKQAKVSLEFESIALYEILDFLGEQWEVPRFLDGGAESYGVDNRIEAVAGEVKLEKPLKELLEKLCTPFGLVPSLQPGFVYVTTPQRLRNLSISVKEEQFAQYRLDEALAAVHRIEFKNVHLTEILAFLSDAADVNIILDYGAVSPPKDEEAAPHPHLESPERLDAEPAPGAFSGAFPGAFRGPFPGAPGTPLPAAGFGEPPEPMPPGQPAIEYVQLDDLLFYDALRALLLPLDLAYRVTSSGVYISTPQRLQSLNLRVAKLETPEEVLVRAMEKPVSLEGNRVEELLREIRTKTGLPVRVLQGALEEPAKAFGFKAEGMPLETAIATLTFVSGTPMALARDGLLVGAKVQQDLSAPSEELE